MHKCWSDLSLAWKAAAILVALDVSIAVLLSVVLSMDTRLSLQPLLRPGVASGDGLALETSLALLHERQWQLSGLFCLFGLIATIPILSCVQRIIGQPLQRLAQASQAVSRGNLAVTVPQSHGEDEIGRLSRDFNAMTAQLRAKEAARGPLLEKLIHIQEEERKRVAQELHDETGQSLASLLIGLKVLGKTATQEESRAQIGELQALTSRTLEAIHRLSVELRPSILDDLGLVPALRSYTREYQAQHKLPVAFEVLGLAERLPPAAELVIYRVVQEALTNIARYARASAVRITFEVLGHELAVQVHDDGVGFDPQILQQGNDARLPLGILGMHERMALISGRLAVETAPGQGTTVSLVIPFKDATVAG